MSSFEIGSYHQVPKPYEGLCSNEPRIIALCEEHDSMVDRLANAHLIMKNFRQGDAVLVETPESEPYCCGQVEYLPKVVPLFGWDSDEGLKPFVDLGYKIQEMMDKVEQFRAKLDTEMTENEFWRAVNEIISSIPEDKLPKSAKSLLSHDGPSNDLAYRYKKGIPYYLTCLINEYGLRTWNDLAYFDPRNKSLIEKLEKIQKTYQRVFVIAGRAHFDSSDLLYTQETHGTTWDVFTYLTSKRCIVLTPQVDQKEEPKMQAELTQAATLYDHIQWVCRYVRYGCSELALAMKRRMTAEKPVRFPWNWHPNAWIDRIRTFKKEDLNRQRETCKGCSFDTLFSEFFYRNSFGLTDGFNS